MPEQAVNGDYVFQMAVDANGFPVLLANVPGSGTALVDPNAKSGNPAHDTKSGKFGSTGTKPDSAHPPGNVDPIEFARMMDAARDAAREFDFPQEGDIREFLVGRAKNPGQVDVPGFLKMVLAQKLNDLVDLIDDQMRASGPLARGRRRVRVVSPKSYVKRAFSKLDDGGVAELMHRLEARGHDPADVEQFVLGRVKKADRHPSIKGLKVNMSDDDWSWDDEVNSTWDLEADDAADERSELIAQFAEIAKNIPPAIINIHPQIIVEAPKATRRIIQRDDKGLMTGIEEVSDAD